MNDDEDYRGSEREEVESLIDELNQALRLDSNSAEAYFRRGNAYTELEENQKAISDYDQSIAINPKVSSPYYNRGNAYYRLGQFEKAIEDYSNAISIDQEFAEAYFNRGLTLFYRLQDKKMALRDFQAAAHWFAARDKREDSFLASQFVLLLDPDIIRNRLQAEAIRPALLNIRVSKERIHLNFDAMSKAHPASLLKFLIRERAHAIASRIRSSQASPADGLTFNSLNDLFNPINPLLLVTAICCSIVRNQDYCSFLSRYVKGRDVSGLESLLLKLSAFDSEEALSKFLTLEEAYVEAFCMIAVEDIIYPEAGEQVIFERAVGDADPGSIIEQFWEKINSNDTVGDWKFSPFNVRWRAWVLANPTLLILTSQSLEARLYAYGFKKNDDIHNAREYYEAHLTNINHQINELLRSSLPKESKSLELQKIKQAQLNAQKLTNRALRLYEWNPSEITANFMGALSKKYVSEILDGILPDSDDEEV